MLTLTLDLKKSYLPMLGQFLKDYEVNTHTVSNLLLLRHNKPINQRIQELRVAANAP